MTELWRVGASELRRLLAAGEVTPREAVDHFLERVDRLNRRLGAFVEVTPDRARQRADALTLDASGSLFGVPLAEKDLTARAGVATRYGSRAFESNVPSESDPLALVLDAAGAVSLGKTSTPEFGLVGYTEPAAGLSAINPWDLSTGAGGSSGGAASAVAAGLLPAAPASDGGGSIRIPAATVGVVGIKPTRGTVAADRSSLSSLSLSVSGPIARSIEDAALLLDAMAAANDRYRSALEHPHRPLRIGVTTASPWDGWTDTSLDPGAARAVHDGIGALEHAGHHLVPVDWRPSGYPEFFTALWRLSAARIPVEDALLDELVEPRTAWLVREGRAMSDAVIRAAQRSAAEFARDTIQAFAPFDAVLMPALALGPRPLGWFDEDDPERDFVQQCQVAPHTSFANVAGLPAVSVPVTRGNGRPWSVQLVGRSRGEGTLIRLARDLEDARGSLPWPAIAVE